MSMRRKFFTAVAVSGLVFAAPALAETIAFTNARVVIGDGNGPIDGGTVIVRDGRIVAAGANVTVPADARIVDASGKWVTPGIVAGFSRVGLVEVGAVSETNDTQANGSPFSAALDIAPAINPATSAIAVSRAAGVTRAVVAPATARSIFAGQGAFIDLGADPNPITRARAFQFVELGEEGARDAGGSRTSAHALFRNALREARDFGNRAKIAGGSARGEPLSQGDDLPPDVRMTDTNAERPNDVLLSRFDAAALVPVVTGRQPLYVHVERASDIRAVLALTREFPKLRLVLVGVSEGWLVARDIAAAKVPVIASALNDLPAAFETLAATQSNIGRMKAAGVTVAIGMINDNDSHQLRYEPQYAGNLVALQKVPGATGLSWGEAFAAISSVPAEIMGLGNRIGSLKAGNVGDVVIWDGDPLELSSAPIAVYIDGVEQPLDNHQTKLRDRYRTPSEGALPKAYQR
ncbi:amidohydrolase family protein [Sphingorhabdus soli]|uniref:Amidohydrolase family protein n=1 Tax=Flavisphingopyxis soli TaxID=2601267 RepID=A0A5C6U8F8_9SPHN|nr:amidohydrolase family protein [Sphingorhabdus soli]TXC68680.1 amidohydrolase family protein [Sphingorhabdus soli]